MYYGFRSLNLMLFKSCGLTRCIAMFESGSPETDLLYLWVELAFGTDASNPNEIRSTVASYSDEPRIKNRPEIKFHEVKKQTV